ncbi:unnamed protein product [Protopolystoma xenopodis]|uniref:Uncharacterized protein n=1 Tax=Protopolystoma xenopodis TaxID=117903 RepID=A0A3S4ZTV5_9PLAT|nr:unnamed protein product [Protopolystoma xenopodis]
MVLVSVVSFSEMVDGVLTQTRLVRPPGCPDRVSFVWPNDRLADGKSHDLLILCRQSDQSADRTDCIFA